MSNAPRDLHDKLLTGSSRSKSFLQYNPSSGKTMD